MYLTGTRAWVCVDILLFFPRQRRRQQWFCFRTKKDINSSSPGKKLSCFIFRRQNDLCSSMEGSNLNAFWCSHSPCHMLWVAHFHFRHKLREEKAGDVSETSFVWPSWRERQSYWDFQILSIYKYLFSWGKGKCRKAFFVFVGFFFVFFNCSSFIFVSIRLSYKSFCRL